MDHFHEELDAAAEVVRLQLASGVRPSSIANDLHSRGLGAIALIYVFRKATGAGIAELKGLGRWWSADGVTDPAEFDSCALAIFSAASAAP